MATLKKMKGFIFKFFKNKEKLSNVMQILHIYGSTRFAKSICWLHLITHFGLEKTMATLLRQRENISARKNFGAMTLHKVTKVRQKNIVQLLLKYDANIKVGNAQDHRAIYRTTIREK